MMTDADFKSGEEMRKAGYAVMFYDMALDECLWQFGAESLRTKYGAVTTIQNRKPSVQLAKIEDVRRAAFK